MTREKAVEMCKSIKHYLTSGNPVWSKEEVAEAMTMATEALTHEETHETHDVCFDIVRCGECAHSTKPWEGICEHPTAEIGDTLAVEADDFCSYGERRSDDTN